MKDENKILEVLHRLENGQRALQANVQALQNGQAVLAEGQKTLTGTTENQSQAIRDLTKTVEKQGKVLTGLTGTVGTILEEQHAQRMDIRSFHTDMRSLHEEIHAAKDELKGEILSSRAEAKRNAMDLQAAVTRRLKGHEERIDELENEAGIPHPDEN